MAGIVGAEVERRDIETVCPKFPAGSNLELTSVTTLLYPAIVKWWTLSLTTLRALIAVCVTEPTYGLQIVTFDSAGVTGHVNHEGCYNGVR